MVHVLARVNIFTTLGIRFIDVATDQAVTSGLDVRARQSGFTGSGVPAFRTASGIYAFQNLPGLQDVEYSDEPGAVTPLPYVVEVTDSTNRFLPVAFEVELPLPNRGLYPEAILASPPEDQPPGFYLFSAPTRQDTPGLAVVRAQLQEPDETPAAHAVLELENQGITWFGIADDQGQIAVQFPYPPLTTVLQGSPPFGGAPLLSQSWDMQIRVRYAPDDLTFYTSIDTPAFASVLNQAEGMLTAVIADGAQSSIQASLDFGEPLSLRTRDGPEELPMLIVEPTP